ncbi:MAG: exodeoxyribonuclease VII small subunit [Candidatus Puniceispirillaceae bacterium]
MTTQTQTSAGELSFEEALRQLEEIVSTLERGDISLDEAIAAYEKGTVLKQHCQKRLEEARLKVEKIDVPAADGAPQTASHFDPTNS